MNIDKLREQLMNFGNIVKDLQHYYYHTKILSLLIIVNIINYIRNYR